MHLNDKIFLLLFLDWRQRTITRNCQRNCQNLMKTKGKNCQTSMQWHPWDLQFASRFDLSDFWTFCWPCIWFTCALMWNDLSNYNRFCGIIYISCCELSNKMHEKYTQVPGASLSLEGAKHLSFQYHT